MSIDRNELEQQALKHIAAGRNEKAQECYVALLKHDPRDRRIRQKLADLYAKMGKKNDAERHYRELAEGFTGDGNHRAAVSVLKQIVVLNPVDPEIQGKLGDALFNAGFRAEAVPCWENAWRALSGREVKKAAAWGKALLRARPEDMALRMRVAEAFAGGGLTKDAMVIYQESIEDFRRKGRLDEVGRIARLALSLSPEDEGLQLAAAEAHLGAGEAEQALQLLGKLVKANPRNKRVLQLIAQALEGGPAPERARPFLAELAAVLEGEGDLAGAVSVLERSQNLGTPDPRLADRLARLQAAATEAAFKLTDSPAFVARSEAEFRHVVRADLFSRYGLFDRADAELSAALADPQALLARAWAAELALQRGRKDEAVSRLDELLARVGPAQRDPVVKRLRALGGGPAAVVEDEDELIDDVDTNGSEAEDDAPTPRPGRAAPAVDDDPFADFGKEPEDEEEPAEEPDPFAAIFKQGGTLAEVSPDDIEPEPISEDGPSAAEIEEAKGMIALGLFSEALDLLGMGGGLMAAALRARCLRELGQVEEALAGLEAEVEVFGEEDPGHNEALFELANLNVRLGKHRQALRFLRELQDMAPDFRPEEVGARTRALMKVLGR